MAVYARSPRRRWGQVIGDLCVLGWIVLWGWTAYRVWTALLALAEPARRTAAAAVRMRDDFRAAAESAGRIPVAGGELRKPFESAGSSLDQVVVAAQAQVRSLEQAAVLGAVVVFVLPVALVLVPWLLSRVRFVQRSTAAQRLIDRGSGVELFALRAIVGQPASVLARISADPVGDWRAGRRPVIMALAELELGSLGIEVPPALRSEVSTADRGGPSPPP